MASEVSIRPGTARRPRAWLGTARGPLTGGTGVQRANRLTVILLALQRLSYLVPALLALDDTSSRSPALTVALVTVTVGWNVALFLAVRRDGWFPW